MRCSRISDHLAGTEDRSELLGSDVAHTRIERRALATLVVRVAADELEHHENAPHHPTLARYHGTMGRILLTAVMLAACGGSDNTSPPGPDPNQGPAAGNPDGHCTVPGEAMPADVTSPRTVVGTGTAASCTGAAFVDAVAKGGVITFNCGADPVTIELDQTAKIVNDTGPEIVIDGGNKVTLSGKGQHRILYMDTCDQAQKWTTSHCQNQDEPHLTVQNLTFVDGNSKGETYDGGGGGAIFYVSNDRSGSLVIQDSVLSHNPSAGFETSGYPGIFVLASGPPMVTNSTIE